MNRAIERYNRHKTLFNISNSKYLNLFEELLRRSNSDIECSVKIKGKRIFPCRFNILMVGKARYLSLSFNFLRNLSNAGAKIDMSLLRQVLNDGLDMNKVEDVLVGIDLRKDFSSSRAKFWLIINEEYVELFNKALELHGYNQKVTDMFNNTELLFGFDFFFDGKTRIKIYSHFDRHNLKNVILRKKLYNAFSPSINRLISECHRLHVSFEGKTHNRILYFHTYSIDRFFNQIKGSIRNKEVMRHVNLIRHFGREWIIALRENEVDSGKIRVMNLYY